MAQKLDWPSRNPRLPLRLRALEQGMAEPLVAPNEPIELLHGSLRPRCMNVVHE